VFTTGIIHERKRKIVETLLSVHAFYDIEKIFDLGRRTQKLCTNCILNLCEYDIHGIKLLSVKFYTFIQFIQVYMCDVRVNSPPTMLTQ
jgi:hypothetical protein